MATYGMVSVLKSWLCPMVSLFNNVFVTSMSNILLNVENMFRNKSTRKRKPSLKWTGSNIFILITFFVFKLCMVFGNILHKWGNKLDKLIIWGSAEYWKFPTRSVICWLRLISDLWYRYGESIDPMVTSFCNHEKTEIIWLKLITEVNVLAYVNNTLIVRSHGSSWLFGESEEDR